MRAAPIRKKVSPKASGVGLVVDRGRRRRPRPWCQANRRIGDAVAQEMAHEPVGRAGASLLKLERRDRRAGARRNGNISRVVRYVCSRAMPMAPPRLRMTLTSAEAEPLSSAAMPRRSAVSGVRTSAWADRARTTGQQQLVGRDVRLMATFMKRCSWARAKPAAISRARRASSSAAASTGSPGAAAGRSIASTRPICWAL